jgi:hypothetical protein
MLILTLNNIVEAGNKINAVYTLMKQNCDEIAIRKNKNLCSSAYLLVY